MAHGKDHVRAGTKSKQRAARLCQVRFGSSQAVGAWPRNGFKNTCNISYLEFPERQMTGTVAKSCPFYWHDQDPPYDRQRPYRDCRDGRAPYTSRHGSGSATDRPRFAGANAGRIARSDRNFSARTCSDRDRPATGRTGGRTPGRERSRSGRRHADHPGYPDATSCGSSGTRRSNYDRCRSDTCTRGDGGYRSRSGGSSSRCWRKRGAACPFGRNRTA